MTSSISKFSIKTSSIYNLYTVEWKKHTTISKCEHSVDYRLQWGVDLSALAWSPLEHTTAILSQWITKDLPASSCFHKLGVINMLIISK